MKFGEGSAELPAGAIGKSWDEDAVSVCFSKY